ncbi:MAG: efflux RND transporter permease subunit [candidate division KSB1 bacterium]|nr:efflux RND transporter permease subunit [candidate division KSB1 bacterium]
MAEIQVFLKPGFRSREVMQALRPELAALYPGAISLQAPQTAIGEILGTARADLEVQIRGNDADSAAVLMQTLRRKLQRIPGITQVVSSEEQKRPEIRLVIDREKAILYDVPPRAIADFVQQVMHGRIATDFKDFDKKIPVLLRADERHRRELMELLAMPLNHGGRTVPVSEMVRLEQTLAPAAIEREDQVRQRSLFASIGGRGYNAVVRDVEKMLQTLELPYGFQVRLGGQRQEMLESFREMVFAFVLAFVLVFMILAAQFESLVHPFVIIFTVPLALIGVVFGLLVTGQSFNVMSLIGLVVLVGIVVNDAIVKVDFINQERRRGTALRQAILLAGQKRLRPILMTTITTVLGLLPMAMGFGEGAELRRPLAIAIIFGLSFATVLTLVVVPVGYQSVQGRRGG